MAGIDINLNLKTINGEPITGTGDIAVNSLNWRGEFASAPSMPVKNDAYHNTTIGNSYIYNGSVWNIFTQKGEAGENGSNGMLFPHETLTGADIGKLVIWKDGKATLPVFEEAVDASPKVIEYTLNIDSFVGFVPDELEVLFILNPSDGDTFDVANYHYEFKTSPAFPNEVQIGATIKDTLDNLLAVSVGWLSTSYTTIRDTDEQITIKAMFAGIGFPYSYVSDQFALPGITGSSYATIISSHTSVADRLGHTLVPFLFIRGLGLTAGASKRDEYIAFSYAMDVIFTTALSLEDLPSSIAEVKAGIVAYLNGHEAIESASWDDDVLTVETFEELPTDIEIDVEDVDYWYDAFDDGIVAEEATPATPAFCKYPILGLVKSVGTTEVEIATEPICKFMSVHEGTVSWDGLLSFNRIFILNPSAPGYLMPFINLIESDYNIVSVLAIAAGGYINAIENEIGTNMTFFGAFSLDIFAVELIVDIFLSGE